MTWSEYTFVFDLDGTLVDTAPDLHCALVHCFAAHGLKAVDLDTIRHAIGHGARAMIQTCASTIGVELTSDALDEMHQSFLDHYIAHIADHSQTFHGIRDTLSFLKAKGSKIAVCTNKTQTLAEEVINTLGIVSYFDGIVGADRASEKKPSSAHVFETIALAGGNPAKAIFIGDSSTDGLAAQAAGLPFVLMLYGYLDDKVDQIPNCGQLQSADELPALFETLIS